MKLQKTLEKKRLLEETRVLRERVAHKYRLENVVGESPQMLALFETIRQVAPSNASVLLLGQSGTGKELLAQALHQLSPRRNRPFIRSPSRMLRPISVTFAAPAASSMIWTA